MKWICRSCARTHDQNAPRCWGCYQWNTLERLEGQVMMDAPKNPFRDAREEAPSGREILVLPDACKIEVVEAAPVPALGVVTLSEVAYEEIVRVESGMPQVDRMVGSFREEGFALGQVMLLSGDRGSGKTRLMLQWARAFSEFGDALILTSEQGLDRVRLAWQEIFSVKPPDALKAWATREWSDGWARARELRPFFLVVDSVQAFLGARPAERIIAMREWVSERNGIIVALSQLNAAGGTLGEHKIEHECDCVLRLEKRRDASGQIEFHDEKPRVSLRIDGKNRFGREDLAAHFLLGETGLTDAPSQRE